MRVLVELSGEHPALARAETLAALEASGRPQHFILAEERLLAVETDADPSWLGRRVALAHFVDELLASGELEDVLLAAKSLNFGGRTFRVRVNSYKGCHNKVELEAQLGGIVTGTVNLAAPDEEVRVIEGERHYLCRRLAAIDRRAYEARKVGAREFVQPISLHPRLARVLVNLSRVPEGGTLLDPFCGTGGVLLEAGLVGVRAIGGDVRADMVEGCRATLRAFGIDATLLAADVGDMPEKVGPVDAVAMDPPYGRATTTKGEPVASLIARGIDAVARVLRPGGYLALSVPDPGLAVPAAGLDLVETYAYPVHRSLTRHFVVMRKRSRSP